MFKKFIKIIALTVAVAMFFSIPAFAKGETAEYEIKELIKNGGFENVAETKAPKNWMARGGVVDKQIIVTQDKVQAGSNALQLSSDGSVYVDQGFHVVGGETYKLSFWCISGTFNAMIKIEFSKIDEKGTSIYFDPFQASVPASGDWEKTERTFVAPEEATNALILVRLLNGGNVFYDEISVVGPSNEVKNNLNNFTVKKPFPGAKSFVKNSGFEELTDSRGAKDWAPMKNEWGGMVSVTDEKAHSGKNSLKLATESGGAPWAMQVITDFIPGTEYQLSAWFNATDFDGERALFKVETYSTKEVKAGFGTGDFNAIFYTDTYEEWSQGSYVFTPPKNCQSIAVYARLYGTGNLFIDDIEFYQTDETKKFYLETDNYFYYTEWEYGYAFASLNSVFPEFSQGAVNFSVRDGDTVLYEKTVKVENEEALFEFPVSVLTEKGREYSVSAAAFDKDGNDMGMIKTPVYRYDRPKMIDDNGNFIVNGKIFNPIFDYHHPEKDFEAAKEAGINLVQAYKATAGFDKMLDHAQELGIMVLFPLYPGMKPAGSLQNRDNTINMVTKYKDHPALFGWMIMDEPFFNNCDENDLFESYKLIKELDPLHPAYVVDPSANNFGKLAKYGDVIAVDPYVGEQGTQLTHISDTTELALRESFYRKPIYHVIQTFDYRGFNPSSDEAMHQAVQVLMAGGKGVGYYCFEQAEADKDLDETASWKGLVEFYKNASDDLFKISQGEYPVFNEVKNDDVWYKTYIKNGELQTIILNLKKEEITAAVNLTSSDGKVKVENFGTETVCGWDVATANVEGSLLSLKMRAGQVVILKIKPSSKLDLSGFAGSQYVDLKNYPWARIQIAALREKNIVNEVTPVSYGPATSITRGDFAMFLIRTLGITSESTENFEDVDTGKEYAKEIAIGKAAGILKGIGDNKFDPEARISRQDLMTIIARGMELRDNGADMSKFSDAGSIADYAIESVKAMISSGLIEGNGDGTINPLGNTTRAEAAVIMYRILTN